MLPLYLYPDEQDLDQSIRLNFDAKIYAQIRKVAGLSAPLSAPSGTNDFRRATGNARPDEIKVFDYIYGVLHCPTYRQTYAEFLKANFPRIPFPPSPEVFETISTKGESLRRLHLMEDAAIGEALYPYHGEGSDVVASGYPKFDSGKVFINEDQYFASVPEIAWNLHVAGYQPAQKWLKDRRGRMLSWDDIGHYQKIVKILTETDRIMQEIDTLIDITVH